MTFQGYRRYVAIGDSQTEGLWDGDDTVGLIGFADRLAQQLDRLQPGLAYANLAVRGRRIRDVLDDQLPQALSMDPDLVTVCIGMNDVTRSASEFDSALTDLGTIHQLLARSGAAVVTTTFPDMTRLAPAGRPLRGRILRINDVIRQAAERHRFGLVDLYRADSMLEPGTWSDDLMHGSARGHELFAAAVAEALELPGSNHDWASPAADRRAPDLTTQALTQVRWATNMFLPWAWLHVRGKSSGDGRDPKRPRLQPVGTCLSR